MAQTSTHSGISSLGLIPYIARPDRVNLCHIKCPGCGLWYKVKAAILLQRITGCEWCGTWLEIYEPKDGKLANE